MDTSITLLVYFVNKIIDDIYKVKRALFIT